MLVLCALGSVLYSIAPAPAFPGIDPTGHWLGKAKLDVSIGASPTKRAKLFAAQIKSALQALTADVAFGKDGTYQLKVSGLPGKKVKAESGQWSVSGATIKTSPTSETTLHKGGTRFFIIDGGKHLSVSIPYNRGVGGMFIFTRESK
jgi:hypothetical protein